MTMKISKRFKSYINHEDTEDHLGLPTHLFQVQKGKSCIKPNGCCVATLRDPPKDQALIIGRPKDQYMPLGAIAQKPLVKNEPISKYEHLNLE